MKLILIFIRFFLIILIMQTAVASTQQSDNDIAQLYHQLNKNSKLDMTARLAFISEYFIGKPYLLGALGEGPHARYDQFPLYRTDAFDCETFVDTVMALALGKNLSGFKQCINHIRYINGKINFIKRNHFISLDWNLNNQKQGFIQDITLSIKNKNNQSIAKVASALINKPGWYEHLKENKIRLLSTSAKIKTRRLNELKLLGSKLERVQATIPYLPLTELFDENGNPNIFVFNQIPSGAIIEIVRPNWNLEENIGTCLNVSHLGFAFRKNSHLLFRQASSSENKIIDVSLIDYLKKALASPTIKGINVHIIIPAHPCKKNDE